MVQEEWVSALYDKCHKLFRYDASTGDLVRRISLCGRAVKGSKCRRRSSSGYYRVDIDGKTYLVHRIIYLMCTGKLPNVIDHVDRNKTNNLIGNLRPADAVLNMLNRDIFKNNTTGVRGVTVTGDKFRARIQVEGRAIFLGKFNTIDEAEKAYNNARVKFGADEESLKRRSERII